MTDKRAPVECECGRIHPFETLERELYRQGLHVVTDADKAVLDAMALIPAWALRRAVDANEPGNHALPACRGELTRRGLEVCRDLMRAIIENRRKP